MSGRLVRSRTDRFLGGVCGGLGKYLGIDPTIVRLIFLLLLLTQGFGFLLYLILWILVPVEGGAEAVSGSVGDRLAEGMKGVGEDIRHVAQTPHPQAGFWIGVGLIVLGVVLVAERVADMLGLEWLTAWMNWSALWPILLIVVGAALIIRGARKEN
ncbi:MAG: PspC domain-containing protein [Anaerolineales bacterium]|nr:PspC domain-containing protein [Anaerolineales bacterium]